MELIYFIAALGLFALACLVYGIVGLYRTKHLK